MWLLLCNLPRTVVCLITRGSEHATGSVIGFMGWLTGTISVLPSMKRWTGSSFSERLNDSQWDQRQITNSVRCVTTINKEKQAHPGSSGVRGSQRGLGSCWSWCGLTHPACLMERFTVSEMLQEQHFNPAALHSRRLH